MTPTVWTRRIAGTFFAGVLFFENAKLKVR